MERLRMRDTADRLDHSAIPGRSRRRKSGARSGARVNPYYGLTAGASGRGGRYAAFSRASLLLT